MSPKGGGRALLRVWRQRRPMTEPLMRRAHTACTTVWGKRWSEERAAPTQVAAQRGRWGDGRAVLCTEHHDVHSHQSHSEIVVAITCE